MQILDHHKIQQKIRRVAIEILENNYEEPELILAGINNNGMTLALLLLESLKEFTSIPITLTRIRLSPANPLGSPIELEMPADELNGKVIVVVDDVANTGRTLFYACKPLMAILPKKIEMAVLVDRTHKSFPIFVNYVGLSLATTLRENIEVKIRDTNEFSVFLE